MKAIINADKCIHCIKCQVAKACSIKAVFRIAEDEPVAIDMSLCHGCGLCVAACPQHAVVMREG